MDVQKMSSKCSSTCSYLTNTKPVWTPQGHAKDVLKGIVYQLFDWHNTCLNTPWTCKWCPQRDPLQVPIWVFQPYSNTPWTCKWCPQIDRLPVLFECRNHIWTPHGRAKDVLKAIVYQFLFDWHKTSLNTTWTSKRCPQNDRLPVPIWLTQHMFEYPMDVQMMSSKWSSTSSYLSVPTLFEHPMDVQQMSSKWSSTSSYLTDTTPAWTPHERPKDVLKVIVYVYLPVPIQKMSSDRLQFLFDQFEHPMDVQKMSSKWSSTSSYLTNTTPVWTPHGRPNDVLKGIVYQFLFDWHNTCLNTPWTSKRCPQNDRLPVPIWLTQHLFEHPMDVQKMSSKGSSTSSYLTDTTPVWTPHGRPNDVLKVILYKFLFECPNPIWTPHRRATDVLKVIVYQFLLDWHNTCLNTPWTSKRCPQKWSSTSSYLTNTKPVWTPQGHAKDVLKGIVYQFLFDWHNTCLNTPWTDKVIAVPIWLTPVLKVIVYQFLFDWHNPSLNNMDVQKMSLFVYLFLFDWHNVEHPKDMQMMSSNWSSTSSYLSVATLFEHPMDVQKMSSKWSSTSSYLTDTTPAWTPHGRPNDVLKVIVYKFLFECHNPIWTPHGRPKDVLKVIVYQFLFDCPQLFEHPMDVQMMSSKGSSTSSYLNNPIWTPHGRAKDVLKLIVYQFLFDWHNTCLNTPWTSKRCPQRDRLPVPIWLTQHLFEHPIDVQMMSSKGSSTSSYLSVPTLFEHPMDVQQMSSKWSSTSSY